MQTEKEKNEAKAQELMGRLDKLLPALETNRATLTALLLSPDNSPQKVMEAVEHVSNMRDVHEQLKEIVKEAHPLGLPVDILQGALDAVGQQISNADTILARWRNPVDSPPLPQAQA